jgi:hypothetical protein
MSISFPKGTAKVVNGKAKVLVRCTGSVSASCVGTLSLKLGGVTHKAVYSVKAGKKKTIAVPLGSNLSLGVSGSTAQVNASTEQPSGSPVKTKRKLKLS